MVETYNLYSYDDYKTAIKDRVRFLKRKSTNLSLKRLAERVPIQYTYLSKVLNDESTHVSEDHLFKITEILGFAEKDIEYFMLLRSLETTQDSKRKDVLQSKVLTEKRKNTVEGSSISNSISHMEYLFNPICTIVHVSLYIEEIRKSPLKLCSLLGIDRERLKQVLKILEKDEYIETGEDILDIKNVNSDPVHFDRSHPFTRIHQSQLKNLLQQKLQQTTEKDKESFIATFTSDEEIAPLIKDKIKNLVAEIQSLTKKRKNSNLYQISIDFGKWL